MLVHSIQNNKREKCALNLKKIVNQMTIIGKTQINQVGQIIVINCLNLLPIS